MIKNTQNKKTLTDFMLGHAMPVYTGSPAGIISSLELPPPHMGSRLRAFSPAWA